ncbi:MAG: hypothetical protein R2706_07680 [Acidimicrobiales bacterium]
MQIVDSALQKARDEGRTVRVALIGAGFMSKGLARQIRYSVPAMEVGVVVAAAPTKAFASLAFADYDDVRRGHHGRTRRGDRCGRRCGDRRLRVGDGK